MTLVEYDKNPTPAVTVAYNVLKQATDQEGTIQIQDFQKRLQMTPGFAVSPGTTMQDVLHKLEQYRLISIRSGRVGLNGEA
jgi:hypothetical protein